MPDASVLSDLQSSGPKQCKEELTNQDYSFTCCQLISHYCSGYRHRRCKYTSAVVDAMDPPKARQRAVAGSSASPLEHCTEERMSRSCENATARSSTAELLQSLYLSHCPDKSLHTTQATMTCKTAYVTGGASGIGLAVAHALNQRGMRVIIADINLTAAQEATSKLQQTATNGQDHLAVEVDVSSWESQVAAFEKAIKAVQRLDIVIVNAGVGEKVFVPNDGGKGQDFVKPNLRILEVDLNGFLYTSALAIQQMRRQGVDSDGLRGSSESRLRTCVRDVQLTLFGKSSAPRRCADSIAYQVSIMHCKRCVDY